MPKRPNSHCGAWVRSTCAPGLDIEPEDDGVPGEPVSVDDVIEIHQFLQGFDGDFRRSSATNSAGLANVNTLARHPSSECRASSRCALTGL